LTTDLAFYGVEASSSGNTQLESSGRSTGRDARGTRIETKVRFPPGWKGGFETEEEEWPERRLERTYAILETNQCGSSGCT